MSSPAAPEPAQRHLPALDGVRTLAVYLVLLFHCGLPGVAGGFIGVDVFFVLSGFLITNVLLDDLEPTDRIRFGRFYGRRARRLLPAALTTIVVTCVAFLLVASVVERLPLIRDAQSALLYVANWRFLDQQNNYFATGVTKSPFLHFWSLGIEEQFYVGYPLVLLLLWRLRRVRWLPIVALAGLLGASLLMQLHWAHADPNHAYYGTDARVYQLLAGALMAWIFRAGARPGVAVASASAALGFVGVVLVGTSLLPLGVSDRGMVAAAAACLLVGGLANTRRGAVFRALSRPMPSYLGRISYGTYLWHWPVILVLAHLWVLPSPVVAAVAGGISTALAAGSYQLLEMPIRRMRLADPWQWASVAVGVATCALVANSLVPPVLGSSRRPALVTAAEPLGPRLAPVGLARGSAQHVGRAATRLRIPAHLDWAALANDFGPERTCDASNPQQCVVVRGSGPHILVVGDSHGRMIAPALIALARERHFTLSLNVLPSCPWQADLSNLSQPPSSQQRCTAARDLWYRTVLPKLHPDLVVLVEYSRDDPAVYGHTLVRTGGSNESLHQLIQDTTNETLTRITSTGARALILKDSITAAFDPLDCLARADFVDQCGVPYPRTWPFSDAVYAAAARHTKGVFAFDVNPIVCERKAVCPAMIDGINVWRNVNHYSTRILVHFREQIWQAMVASGALA
ncbi:MAG TPA: acyltransferase family protein [Mycobacteriales bacterium]|nr:acyltransferase family protein [Mycobacteriales bacterium]